MQDLLNEEEFLVKQYNIKPWVYKFYTSAIASEIVLLTVFHFVVLPNRNLSLFLGIITGLIIPPGLAMFMIFTKKEMLLETPKTEIAKAVFILLCCFYIPKTISMAYTYLKIYLQEMVTDIFFMLLIPICTLLVLYGITLSIILPLVNRARKINNRILPQ